MTSLSETSVSVSWNALVIPDFSIDNYTVVYSPVSGDGEMTAVFPGSVTTGIITDLDPALNYQFQVFATVTVDGVPLEGERSDLESTSKDISLTRGLYNNVTLYISARDVGGPEENSSNVGGIVAGVIVALVVVILVIAIIAAIIWL